MESKNTHYVPWSCRREYDHVKDLIFSGNPQDMKRGYEILLMWKVKCNEIPTYIECTSSLMQVILNETHFATPEDFTAEYNLRLCYTTAFIRFINHITSLKGETIYAGARELGLPDWMVNLRHDATHAQALPALDVLKMSVDFAFSWLKEKFWDFSFVEIPNLQNNDDSVAVMFRQILDVWKLLALAHASGDTSYDLNTDVHNFRGIFNEQPKINSSSEKKLLILLNNPPENGLIKTEELLKIVLNLFGDLTQKYLNQNSLKIIITIITDPTFNRKMDVVLFEDIIFIIQKHHGFTQLFEKLFQLLVCEDSTSTASNWLVTLAPSIIFLNKTWNLYKDLQRKNPKNENNITLKEKAIKIMLAQSENNLHVSVGLYKPPKLTLEMFQSILREANAATRDIVTCYWECLSPPLPQSVLTTLIKLLDVYQGSFVTEGEDEDNEIFTVHDLSNFKQNGVDIGNYQKMRLDESSTWKYSDIDTEEWSKCPLGLLPWQSEINLQLPLHFKWQKTPM